MKKSNPIGVLTLWLLLTAWIVQIVLIVLKVMRLISCNWFMVFLPIITVCVLFAMILFGAVILGGDDD